MGKRDSLSNEWEQRFEELWPILQPEEQQELLKTMREMLLQQKLEELQEIAKHLDVYSICELVNYAASLADTPLIVEM